MLNTPTAHIESEQSQIAKNVIMPGDPLRAKYIAENFLEDVVCVNTVRNCLGYTGTYHGKKITVFASGMGMPSIGIYSYELFKYYGVENIIRVGTAGSYSKEIEVLDIILTEKSYSDSSFAFVQNGFQGEYIEASEKLNQKILETAEANHVKIKKQTIYSSDVFYNDIPSKIVEKHELKIVEMESFALFHTAKILGKHAACLLTISNNFETGEETTSQMREQGFKEMMILALESCL
ncbi:MAG: purine-nucleoside phosphorylase [Bacilli bacterium]|nr:purine-nucleoside phosphorylase [Bacilli bacterium]